MDDASRPREPRAETVGSLLRGAAVLRAARRDSLADQAVLDDAARDAIKLQEEIGLDVITDGEVRRTGWVQTPRWLDAFAVTEGRGALNWRGGTDGTGQAGGSGGLRAGGYGGGSPGERSAPRDGSSQRGIGQHSGGYPAVVRRVATAARTGDMTAEYAFLARYAQARTKFTMPAPSYHRRFWSAQHSRVAYDGVEEYLGEIRDWLRSQVATLITLGCDYIQLDAPNYGSYCDPGTRAALVAAGRDPDLDLAFDADLDNSLFDEVGSPGLTTALHICRGNGPRGMWHSTGGYGVIADRLFPRLTAFSRLLLEYDSDRAGGFEPIAACLPGSVVVLGLITTKSDTRDDEEAVAARIAEAARYKPLEELALSTQCGFASAPGENPVTPAGQRAKLELVARLARRTWG
jgi:5-methyltetrahydropteroyltriglutamate--homocysteine methyltransferase